MSAIAPAPDLELIEHLDHEPHLACEHQCDCVRDATVLMICRDCRVSGAMCGPCVGELRAWMRSRVAESALLDPGSIGSFTFVCKRCNRQGDSLEELFELVPIGGC